MDINKYIENDCLTHIRQSNRKINQIRFSTSEGLLHRHAKAKVCRQLIANKENFITEAIFNNGGRADIINLSKGQIIEILVTESKEMAKKKLDVYPKHLDIKFLRAYDDYGKVQLIEEKI